MAPISKMTIDPVDSRTWLTPWEMLHSGDFCENSIALGMSYTIFYANENIPNESVDSACVAGAQNNTKYNAWNGNDHILTVCIKNT